MQSLNSGQLDAFAAVVRCQSFSLAAKELLVTRSALWMVGPSALARPSWATQVWLCHYTQPHYSKLHGQVVSALREKASRWL